MVSWTVSWTILVNRSGSHNKFWAYKSNTIRWGRLGTMGVERVGFDVTNIRMRAMKKLGNGYRYATDDEYAEFFPDKRLMLWEV